MSKRYVIMELSDAKELAGSAISSTDNVSKMKKRMDSETGADIEDIVKQLKAMDPCSACVIEGQEQTCLFYHANGIGRRINRLLERANGVRA